MTSSLKKIRLGGLGEGWSWIWMMMMCLIRHLTITVSSVVRAVLTVPTNPTLMIPTPRHTHHPGRPPRPSFSLPNHHPRSGNIPDHHHLHPCLYPRLPLPFCLPNSHTSTAALHSFIDKVPHPVFLLSSALSGIMMP